MINTFSAMLKQTLRKHMNDYADTLATGNCSDWPGYQKLVGVIEGLAIAERELLDLTKTALEGDEK